MQEDREITTAYGHEDVDIRSDDECYAGFMKIRRLQLRHRLYAGGWSQAIQREVVQRAPGVGVLLYDPELDKVLLVEQFRVGCLESARGPWKLELVAGLIDTEESPEQVAVREAKEEAGVDIANPFPFTRYYLSPGSSTETMQLFCAAFDARGHAETDVHGEPRRTTGVYGLDDENEDIRVVIIDRQDAEKAMGDGIIDNAMTIIALQWLALNLESVRQKLATNDTAKHGI